MAPGLLQAISRPVALNAVVDGVAVEQPEEGGGANVDAVNDEAKQDESDTASCSSGRGGVPDELLDQARRVDAEHRRVNQKPISADTPRARLGVGAKRARRLVKIVRAEYQASLGGHPDDISAETGADRVAA